MRIVLHVARHTWRWSLRLTLLGVLLALLGIGTLWILLPQARHFHDELARALGEHLRAPVAITRLVGRWQGIHPSVEIRGFALHHPDSGARLLQFRRAEAVLDLPASLWERRLVLRKLILQGGELTLARSTQGWHLLPGDDVAQTGERLDLAALESLLLGMRSLTLELDSLRLALGDRPPEMLVFEDLRLALSVNGWERRLRLWVTPPGEARRRLWGRVDMDTDRDFRLREARFFLRGDGIALQPYSPLLGSLGGELDVDLRGQWNGTLERLRGRLAISDPVPPGGGQHPQLGHLLNELAVVRSELSWHRQDTGWRGQIQLQGQDENARRHWDTTLNLHRVHAEAPLQGEFQQLPVGLLGALATPWLDQALERHLVRLEPSGRFTDTRFQLSADLHEFAVQSRFEDLSIRGAGDIPTLDGLDGSLRWDRRGGSLTLASHFLSVSGAPLAAPVELSLEGALNWQRHGDGVALTLREIRLDNADISATLDGSLRLGEDRWADLRLGVERLALQRLPRYLPATLMKPRLVNWLRQALMAGRVRDGVGLLQGRLANFPFADGNGTFELRLPVEQVKLQYAPDWPALEAGHGEVRLRNREFTVSVAGGRLLDTELLHATARIARLGQPPMTINATARGPADSFLRAVRQSNAPAPVKRQLARIEMDGQPQLTVNLLFPFRQQPPVVSGSVALEGSDIRLPRHRLALREVRGDLGFGPAGLHGEALALQLHGRPASLDVDTETLADGARRSRFVLAGEPDLARLFPGSAPLLERFQGRSRWRAEVTPAGAEGFRLRLQSDLAGTRIRLPDPLGKPTGESRPLTLEADMSPGQVDVALGMAPDLSARLRWAGNSTPRLSRGEVRWRAGEAELPDEPGVALIGRLETLTLGGDGGTGGELPSTLPDWFRSLDLAVETLALGRHRLPDLHLKLHRASATSLQGSVSGETAAGRLQLPLDGTAPLRAELHWLRLPAPAGMETSATPTTPAGGDPGRLPALHLSVAQLQIAGEAWGALELQAEHFAGGWRLDPIVLGNRAQRLAGNGDWRRTPQGQLTRLQLNLQSQALGDTLRKLGLEPGLSGAPASALLSLAWTDALFRPSLPRLSGQLDLDIGAGRFLSLEPGSLGRLLGLISLYGLERRLSLDFSDVNAEGLGFDAIRGSVRLGNGMARSDNLLLTSPAARVHLEGKVGLLEHTLDQTVTVVPRIGTSLGLAGTLVGGPVVGAAVLAADTLLPGGVGQVTQLAYRITGSWQDPQIQRITTLPPQAPVDPLGTITNR